MERDNFDRWSLFFQCITALGLGLTAASLWVSLWGVSQDHEKDRRTQAAEQIKYLSAQINQYRNQLYSNFPGLSDDTKKKNLSLQDGKNLFNACSKENKNYPNPKYSCEAREVTGNWLNALDTISSYHWNQVADRKMIETSVGGVIVEDYEFFKSFLDYASEVKKRTVYQDFQNVSKFIKNKRNQVGSGAGKTG